MKEILRILHNPIIRTIGICLVIYFALFSKKDHPDALSNRLNGDKIKENLSAAKDKTIFIASNVKLAKSQLENLKQNEPAAKTLTTQELEAGNGQEISACGDELEISYAAYKTDNQRLGFIPKQSIKIGSKKDPFLEKNSEGMRVGAIRSIEIPQDFQSDDNFLNRLLKFSQSNVIYQISLLSLKKNSDPNFSCK